jgi:Rps23 Pro-64 3,4-dihydroxylase Tpa1-like proline 4-hydroxylase
MNAVTAPGLCLARPDFLSAHDHEAMLDHALSQEGRCEPSHVGAGMDAHTRRSLAIGDLGPCRQIIRDAVASLVEEFAQAFGVTISEERRFDGSMNAHTDGAFYKPHVDMGGSSFHRTRVLSAVYYFFRTPAAFTGGELRLFRLDRPGEFVDVPATDNQLVVFPSMVPHEVRPVSVPSGNYADARFAFNLWVHNVAEKEVPKA